MACMKKDIPCIYTYEIYKAHSASIQFDPTAFGQRGSILYCKYSFCKTDNVVLWLFVRGTNLSMRMAHIKIRFVQVDP